MASGSDFIEYSVRTEFKAEQGMIQHLRSLSKDTFVYGLSGTILLLFGLITMPIFTRVFSPDDYGVIELIGTISAFLGLLLIFGMDSASSRSYWDCSVQEQKEAVISTGFWFLVVWGLLITGCALLCSNWISVYILGSDQYTDLLRIALITVPLSILITYCQMTIRLHFEPWKFTVVALCSAVFTTGLAILLVLHFKIGLMGYFGGILSGYVVTLLLALFSVRKDLSFTYSWMKIKEMVSYGGPLVPASLAYYVFTLSNRFFLAKSASLDEVGLFSVAVKVSGILLLLYAALSLAWTPFVFKMYSESEARMKEVISRFAKYILIGFSFVAVVLSTFSREVLFILTTQQYAGAYIAIAPLCFGTVAYASTHFTALGISLSRKTKYLALFSWVAAILNLLLNILLIPALGILGAAIASALSFIALTSCYYTISQKLYPIAYDKMSFLKVGIICMLFTGLGGYLVFDSFLLGILIKFAIILLFILALFLLRIFDQQELTYIRQGTSGLLAIRNLSELKRLIRDMTGGQH